MNQNKKSSAEPVCKPESSSDRSSSGLLRLKNRWLGNTQISNRVFRHLSCLWTKNLLGHSPSFPGAHLFYLRELHDRTVCSWGGSSCKSHVKKVWRGNMRNKKRRLPGADMWANMLFRTNNFFGISKIEKLDHSLTNILNIFQSSVGARLLDSRDFRLSSPPQTNRKQIAQSAVEVVAHPMLKRCWGSRPRNANSSLSSSGCFRWVLWQ